MEIKELKKKSVAFITMHPSIHDCVAHFLNPNHVVEWSVLGFGIKFIIN